VCHQSPKYYIEIWHERSFSLQRGESSPQIWGEERRIWERVEEKCGGRKRERGWAGIALEEELRGAGRGWERLRVRRGRSGAAPRRGGGV
jgi:hypothetical protein